MDKYNHWIGKFFAKRNNTINYAITLGQTTYYSCDESLVTPGWRAEEDWHKEQWKSFLFPFKYLWYNLTVGYDKNPYEIEAKKVRAAVEAQTK